MSAVRGQSVDRVPTRFNGSADRLARNIAVELKLPLDGDWFEALLQHLRIDMRMVDTQVVSGDYSGDFLNLAAAETARDVDKLWPAKWIPENRSLAHAEKQIAAWDAGGNSPAVQLRLPSLFGMVRRMRGDTPALMDLAENNDVFARIMERMESFNAAMIDRAFDLFGTRLDMVYLADELGMQTGLLFAPGQIRALFLPRFERLFRRVHDRGGKVFFHSCGAIEPLIADLVAAGVDILNPIQPYVPGMDPEHLAARFGGTVAFCGGMDMQRLMPQGTPQEIAAEAARYRRCLAPRYILDLANILHPDIPPRNVVALYMAAGRVPA